MLPFSQTIIHSNTNMINRQSNHMANIVRPNGGYGMSDETPATAFHKIFKLASLILSQPFWILYGNKNTKKIVNLLNYYFACTTMQRFCSIHQEMKRWRSEKHSNSSFRKCFVGCLFQQCSNFKLLNLLELFLRNLFPIQVSRNNFLTPGIRWHLTSK